MKPNNNRKFQPFKKEWDFGHVGVRKINFGSWKFAWLYNRENIYKRYLIAGLMGGLIGVFGFFLLQKTGIYNLGATGLFQGISRLVSFILIDKNYSREDVTIVYNVLFWLLNFILNLPFVIFSYFKIGKQFTFISLIGIFVSTLMGLILSFIPNLQNFYIFSDPLTFNQNLTNKNIQILLWFDVNKLSTDEFVNDSSRIVIALIYGVASGLFVSLPTTVIYIIGGCTGGLGWYLFYYSKKTMKFFGTVSFYINFGVTFVSFLIGTYIPYFITTLSLEKNVDYAKLISNFFSPILISIFLSVWIRKLVTAKIYPQFKAVLVKIYSDKIHQIRQLFLNEKLAHAFTINNSVGGYSMKKHSNIEIVCFYREVPKILNLVRQLDKNCLFVSTILLSVQGNFRVESDFD